MPNENTLHGTASGLTIRNTGKHERRVVGKPKLEGVLSRLFLLPVFYSRATRQGLPSSKLAYQPMPRYITDVFLINPLAMRLERLPSRFCRLARYFIPITSIREVGENTENTYESSKMTRNLFSHAFIQRCIAFHPLWPMGLATRELGLSFPLFRNQLLLIFQIAFLPTFLKNCLNDSGRLPVPAAGHIPEASLP